MQVTFAEIYSDKEKTGRATCNSLKCVHSTLFLIHSLLPWQSRVVKSGRNPIAQRPCPSRQVVRLKSSDQMPDSLAYPGTRCTSLPLWKLIQFVGSMYGDGGTPSPSREREAGNQSFDNNCRKSAKKHCIWAVLPRTASALSASAGLAKRTRMSPLVLRRKEVAEPRISDAEKPSASSSSRILEIRARSRRLTKD